MLDKLLNPFSNSKNNEGTTENKPEQFKNCQQVDAADNKYMKKHLFLICICSRNNEESLKKKINKFKSYMPADKVEITWFPKPFDGMSNKSFILEVLNMYKNKNYDSYSCMVIINEFQRNDYLEYDDKFVVNTYITKNENGEIFLQRLNGENNG